MDKSEKKYVPVNISVDLIEEVDKIVETYPYYRTRSEFVADAIRNLVLKFTYPNIADEILLDPRDKDKKNNIKNNY